MLAARTSTKGLLCDAKLLARANSLRRKEKRDCSTSIKLIRFNSQLTMQASARDSHEDLPARFSTAANARVSALISICTFAKLNSLMHVTLYHTPARSPADSLLIDFGLLNLTRVFSLIAALETSRAKSFPPQLFLSFEDQTAIVMTQSTITKWLRITKSTDLKADRALRYIMSGARAPP